MNRVMGTHVKYQARNSITTVPWSSQAILLVKVEYLWEVIVQATIWLHLLYDQRHISENDIENVAETCRNILERCGSRKSLDCCIVFLCASRMTFIYHGGTSLNDIQLTLQDLFVSSPKMHTLSHFWCGGVQQNQRQLAMAIQFLKQLYTRRPECRGLALITAEMLLVAADINNSQPGPEGPKEPLELSMQSWIGFQATG